MQKFKNDAVENKFIEAGTPLMDDVSLQKDEFLEGAYSTYPFGDLIYEMGLSPLSNAIDQEIFRQTFPEIVEAFVVAGSFESYIDIFKKIFGDDVGITFTVPAPGKLNILIEAEGVEESPFISRYIQDNAYIFDNIVEDDNVDPDDQIVFQTIQGFQSQYELEQMLFEMVPAGIYTEIDLQLGA